MQRRLWGINLCGAFAVAASLTVLKWLIPFIQQNLAMGILPLIFVISFTITGICLMRLRSWSRVLYMYHMVIWVGIGISSYMSLTSRSSGEQLFFAFVLCFVLPAILTITYLLNPSIKSRFEDTVHWLGKKILIVDDDQGFTKMVKTNLSDRGFEVIVAVTGERGLVLAQARRPDLILLDVILPGIKGREVCTRLKNNPQTKSIPVIFLTAKNSPDDIRAEMEAGGLTHITKPVDFTKLLDEINRTLGIV